MAIDYEIQDEVAVITINRPERLNALDRPSLGELGKLWIESRDNPEVKVILVTGHGTKAFSAGGDLKAMSERTRASYDEEFWDLDRQRYILGPIQCWKPTIAAINGYCLGGGLSVAMQCDIRIAGEGSTFSMNEVKRGLSASYGAARMARIIPFAKALELCIVGNDIDATEAYRIGLINRLVPVDQVMPVAMDMAKEIASNAPLAVRAMKEVLYRGREMTLDDAQRLGESFVRIVRESDDYHEGVAAFSEHRKPSFKGR